LAQYVTAMKYARKRRLEVLVRDGVKHPDIEDKNNYEETNERMTEWFQVSYLTDNKLLNDSIQNATMDIGKNKGWSISDYKERRQTTIDGTEFLKQIANMYYSNNKSNDSDTTLKIPTTKLATSIQQNHWHWTKEQWSWLSLTS
jgi:hypothetical protein